MKHVFYYKIERDLIVKFIVSIVFIFLLIIIVFTANFTVDSKTSSIIPSEVVIFLVKTLFVYTIIHFTVGAIALGIRLRMIRQKNIALTIEPELITIRSSFLVRKIFISSLKSIVLQYELRRVHGRYKEERFVVTFKYKNGKQFKLDMDQFDGANPEVVQNIFTEYNIPIHT